MRSISSDLNEINMNHIAYCRVSGTSQSILSQKAALTHTKLIDKEFMDEGVSCC
jgi:hypothetical protein